MQLTFSFGGSRKEAERKATDFERRISEIATTVAGRFSRGNVALQRGYTVTREQLDAEREQLKNTDRR